MWHLIRLVRDTSTLIKVGTAVTKTAPMVFDRISGTSNIAIFGKSSTAIVEVLNELRPASRQLWTREDLFVVLACCLGNYSEQEVRWRKSPSETCDLLLRGYRLSEEAESETTLLLLKEIESVSAVTAGMPILRLQVFGDSPMTTLVRESDITIPVVGRAAKVGLTFAAQGFEKLRAARAEQHLQSALNVIARILLGAGFSTSECHQMLVAQGASSAAIEVAFAG